MTDREDVMPDAAPEHPGPYRGSRSDYPALSSYWAKRCRFAEAEIKRLREENARLHAAFTEQREALKRLRPSDITAPPSERTP